MRLAVLADLHGSVAHLQAIRGCLAGADAVVIAGDVTHFGGADAAAHIIQAMEAINPHIAAVHGNCDRAEVQTYLADRGMGVHGQAKRLGHLTFVGVGGALIGSGRTPNEADDSTLCAALHQASQGLDPSCGPGPQAMVLVTHQPAYGTRLDTPLVGGHTGSRAIRAFIEQYRPILAVSGHLHESVGVDQIGPTTLLNPGPFKQGCYAVVEIDGQGAKVELKTA